VFFFLAVNNFRGGRVIPALSSARHGAWETRLPELPTHIVAPVDMHHVVRVLYDFIPSRPCART
jgi:hypothetical protein